MNTPTILRAYEKPVVELDVSDWYRNEEFVQYISGDHKPTTRLATWHVNGQDPVTSPSEVFVMVDPGFHEGEAAEAEGSEMSTAPKWVWEQIILACREAIPYGVNEAIMVRLENTEIE